MHLIDELKQLSKLLRAEQDFYKREEILTEMEMVLARLRMQLASY
jgi:hypothetical protein